jgi:hypothetical protein
VLCRDARDGHDKLSLEARKQSLEGARRRWEGSIALTLSLQTLVTPSIPSTLPSSLPVTTSTSTALRPLPGHDTSPLPALVNEAHTEGTDPTTLVTVKIEKSSADSVAEVNHVQHSTESTAITAIKSETETSTTTLTLTPLKSSSNSSSNSSGPGCGVSAESLYPYPPIAMKLEDMPVPACRIVNPFSNGNRGAWDWLTAPYKPHVASPATDPTPSSSSSSSFPSSSSSSAPTSSSPPTVPAHYTQDPRSFHKQSLYNPNYENNSSASQDPSRARCRAYADSILQASGSSGCFDHCVKRATGLLRMDLNAIIVDECLGKH